MQQTGSLKWRARSGCRNRRDASTELKVLGAVPD